MVKKEIELLIKKALINLQKEKNLPAFEIPYFKVEFQKEKNFGDLSSNVAIIISKTIKRDSIEVAEKIKIKF